MKRRESDLGRFFVSYGWLCALTLIASVAVFTLSLNAIDHVRDYESVDYFFECYEVKENMLIEDTMDAYRDEGIVQSRIYHISKDDATKNSYFESHGLFSDIVLLYESEISGFQDVIGDYFRSMDEAFLSKALEGIEDGYGRYEAYGAVYGLKIHDPSDPEYAERFCFTDLLRFEKEEEAGEAVYLLVPTRSEMYGEKNEVGFMALNAFLRRYER